MEGRGGQRLGRQLMWSYGLEYIMSPVLLLVSIAVIKTMLKSKLWKKGFIIPQRLQYITQRKWGRNLEAGTRAETMEECGYLACFSCLLRLLSYSFQWPVCWGHFLYGAGVSTSLLGACVKLLYN